MPAADLITLIITGLAAGILGGLLGIGGSVIMIPVLTILLERSQHLAQASAMIVNVFVALPSAYRHHRAQAVRWDAFLRFLPFALVTILIGVHVSDLFEDRWEKMLTRMFGAFLIYVVAINVMRMLRRTPEPKPGETRATWTRCGFVGGVTGFMAGLLGIGGGIIAVPLLQRVCKLPLRQCIATSSAVMVVTAIVGAIRKNQTLALHESAAGVTLDAQQSIYIAACLAPTAIIGGLFGARLTHILPLLWVRIVFLALLSLAAIRMLAF